MKQLKLVLLSKCAISDEQCRRWCTSLVQTDQKRWTPQWKVKSTHKSSLIIQCRWILTTWLYFWEWWKQKWWRWNYRWKYTLQLEKAWLRREESSKSPTPQSAPLIHSTQKHSNKSHQTIWTRCCDPADSHLESNGFLLWWQHLCGIPPNQGHIM